MFKSWNYRLFRAKYTGSGASGYAVVCNLARKTPATLEEKSVVAKFATTTQHGAIKGKTQTTITEYYNLDVIISVGYQVKSKQGTLFRIWATRVLKDYLLKGYAINNRMNRLEDNMEVLKHKVNEIDLQINTRLIPTQGVFFDGQVFDAYGLISKIIRTAKDTTTKTATTKK